MAGVLPPLGNGPRGSRVWQGDALHPTPRPLGVGLFERHAAWPGFYRRGTTGATARRSGRAMPCTPYRARWARGCSWDMQLGCEATAARRQASRLAGLVRLPAVWPIQTAIRRQASWLAITASMKSKSRWPFALQKYPSHIKASQPARGKYAPRRLRRSRAAIGSGGKKARPF